MERQTQQVMFSSASGEWTTPPELFKELDQEFHFTTDVGATKENALCSDYLGLDNGRDALTSEWGERNYSNPPYGRILYAWIKKGYEESRKGKLVVLLLPARTDTAWFHDFCLKGEIRAIRGRLRFGGAKNGAPFPSMIVIFRPQTL